MVNEGCSGWFTKTRFGRAHKPSSTPKFDELIIGHLAQTFEQFIAVNTIERVAGSLLPHLEGYGRTFQIRGSSPATYHTVRTDKSERKTDGCEVTRSYFSSSRLPRLFVLSATIAKGSGSPTMSKPSKRSIEQYYAEYPEHDRLSSARGQLEFERTKRIVQRFLATPPAIVADVGGGTGPYSFWLASLGYETHLIEPSIRLVEICKNRMQASSSQARPLTVEVGDARSLWLGDTSCDAVLMFGPLYHLTERDDRIRALRESRRVLKSGGYAFAATITRVASFIDALCHGLLGDPVFPSIVAADIETGQHRNPTHEILYFTDAFFHRRAEIRVEMEDAGFEVVAQLPIEGLGILAQRLDSLWSDFRERSSLLELLDRTEGIEEVNGASAHYMSVGMKR